MRRLITTLILLHFALVTWAQEKACTDIVDMALLDMSENCKGLTRNSLCYGHSTVGATFTSAEEAIDFEESGSRAPLSRLRSLRTSALDAEVGHWGLAVLNVSANLPQTRAGPGLILLLAGDALITREDDADQLADIAEPLSAAAMSKSQRYVHPSKIAETAGLLQMNEIALVDAVNRAGDWLRVVSDGTVSWVEAEGLTPLQAMESLPIIEAGEPYAMSALSFWSSPDDADCEAASPALVIQAPADKPVSLTVNGADIRLDSLVSLRHIRPDALSLTVHSGTMTTTFGDKVSAGNTVIGILGETAEGPMRILEWRGEGPASDSERALGLRMRAALNRLALHNGWGAYAADIPPGPLIHTVADGDTLFALARHYDTRVSDIITANSGISPSLIHVGSALLIPNPGSGFGGF